MLHFVTSAQATDHVTSSDEARKVEGLVGGGGYVLNTKSKMSASMVDSNTLRILAGDAIFCGRQWNITNHEDVTIENGTPGVNSIALVVANMKTAPSETLTLKVYEGEQTTGEPTVPSYIQGDLNAGVTEAEMPLYSVRKTGLSVSDPVCLFATYENAVTYRNDITQYQNDMNSFKNDMTNFKSNMNSFKNDMTNFQSSMNQFRNDMASFQSTMNQFRSEFNSFRDSMNRFRDSISQTICVETSGNAQIGNYDTSITFGKTIARIGDGFATDGSGRIYVGFTGAVLVIGSVYMTNINSSHTKQAFVTNSRLGNVASVACNLNVNVELNFSPRIVYVQPGDLIYITARTWVANATARISGALLLRRVS